MICDDITAMRIIRDYVCSHCYGGLIESFLPNRMSKVICQKCGDDAGFVRREYAEAKREESRAEKSEIVDLLKTLGIIEPGPTRTIEQNLKELGF